MRIALFSLLLLLTACGTSYDHVTFNNITKPGEYKITSIMVDSSDDTGTTTEKAVTDTELQLTRAQLSEKLPPLLADITASRPATLHITLKSVNKSINAAQAFLVGDNMYINSDVKIIDNATQQPLASSPVNVAGYGRAGLIGIASSSMMGEESQFDTLTTAYADKLIKTFYPSKRD